MKLSKHSVFGSMADHEFTVSSLLEKEEDTAYSACLAMSEA
jgi:hypothetical protein